MTDEEIDEFVRLAIDELDRKQAELERRFGIGSHARFWLDQFAGTLAFRDVSERDQVVAQITPIGTHSSATKSWQWGWANRNVPRHLRKRAHRLRELAAITGIAIFAQRVVSADELMAEEFTALGVSHLGSQGWYRVPMAHVVAYFALDGVCNVS